MPNRKSEDAQIVSVRLPRALIQRLDRYLDWQNLHRQTKSSRNAVIRQALNNWLDEQEQRTLVTEAENAYQNAVYLVEETGTIPEPLLAQKLHELGVSLQKNETLEEGN